MELLPVDGTFWERLVGGALGDFHDELLISSLSFEADWPTWEIHPAGDELVCLLEGAVTLVLEVRGGERRVELTEPGSFVVVPRGTWHTAKVRRPSRMLFLTPGEGTENRPLEG
jgi:mannose-6-phosphate isomerase-like protein (cupin superfamily)